VTFTEFAPTATEFPPTALRAHLLINVAANNNAKN